MLSLQREILSEFRRLWAPFWIPKKWRCTLLKVWKICLYRKCLDTNRILQNVSSTRLMGCHRVWIAVHCLRRVKDPKQQIVNSILAKKTHWFCQNKTWLSGFHDHDSMTWFAGDTKAAEQLRFSLRRFVWSWKTPLDNTCNKAVAAPCLFHISSQ